MQRDDDGPRREQAKPEAHDNLVESDAREPEGELAPGPLREGWRPAEEPSAPASEPTELEEEPPPELPTTFAVEKEPEAAPNVEWTREEVEPPPPRRNRVLELFNLLRVSLGFRRLPDGVRLDYALPPLRDFLLDSEPKALRRALVYVSAVVVFGGLAFLVFWCYGVVAPGLAATEAAAGRELLSRALVRLEAGDPEGARQLRDKLEAKHANDPSLHFLDGYLLAMQREEGAQEAEKLSRRVWSRRRAARNHIILGGYREAKGDYRGAVEALVEAARLAPNNTAIRLLKASAQLGVGEYAEACEEANAIERKEGPNAPVFAIRGMAYLHSGQPAEARRQFEAALLYEPSAARIRLGLASALVQLGEYDQALSELREVERFYPESADVYAELGGVRESTGDVDGAEKAYRKAIELDPRHARSLNNLAYLLAVERERPAEALPYIERAYKLAPSAPPVLDTLGWTYHLLGRDNEALPLLRKAAALMPGSPDVQFHLAETALAQGKSAEAMRILKELAATREDTPIRRRAREQLRALQGAQ